jgi:hypothetical protein
LIKYIVLDDSHGLPNRNPSRAYNLGFNSADGDIIIIQNAECMHLGDIITYVNNNFSYDDYFSFPCYSSNNKGINNLLVNNNGSLDISNIEQNTAKDNIDLSVSNYPVWFQHPTKSNRNLHFCTVISNNYIKILNGFGELYYDGVGFEDDDLLLRIKSLKLNIVSFDTDQNIGVVHLFHGNRANALSDPSIPSDITWDSIKTKYELNKKIFEQTKNQKPFHTPKIFHYYWDDLTKFTYYNYISLLSAIYYHKDWIHIVWMPRNVNKNITWIEYCNKDQIYNDNYSLYVQHLKSFANIRFFTIDECDIFNLPNDMSEVHKKDILSYMIIYLYGGIWSDLDILYIKNINSLITENFDNLICNYHLNPDGYDINVFPVGFFCSKNKTKYFKSIIDDVFNFYNKNIYQSVGSLMLLSKFGKISNLDKLYEEDNKIVTDDFYMPYLWYDEDIDILFGNYDQSNVKNLSNTLGIHWFNGSKKTKKYLETYEKEKIHNKGLLNNLSCHLKKKNKFKIITHDNQSKNYQFYNEVKNYYMKILSQHFEVVHNSIQKVYNGGEHSFLDNNIETYFQDYDTIYVFNELDYVYLVLNYTYTDKEKALNIINKIDYFVYFSEMFIDKSLLHFGLGIIENDFSKIFFQKAKKIILQDTTNKILLLENNIPNENIIYHPVYGYSEINNIVPLMFADKEIDVLIYGNYPINKITGEHFFTYRVSLTNKIKLFCETNGYKFVVSDSLYDDDKNNLLKKSKIVVHVPSHPIRTIPWAKISELMSKKIFFMVEETLELYCRNLQNQIVFYKKDDDIDLFDKLSKFINDDIVRQEHIEKNFQYVKNEYNMDKNILSIASML